MYAILFADRICSFDFLIKLSSKRNFSHFLCGQKPHICSREIIFCLHAPITNALKTGTSRSDEKKV
jgi:hypothetical protein